MEPRYDPHGVEERWQQTWEEEGLYKADPDASRPTYVDAHPPPNVTGELHMGHALQLALGDTIVRLQRMHGFDTLWQPGYDHAGISTQNVVEKQLLAEGTSRQELGREAFEARVWEWLDEVGGMIMDQFRRMGASLDYSRERFTMDAGYVDAVMRFFVRLYEKGWIYRANRIVNWCPYHQTAISDLEVEHVDLDDTLSTIRYPFADGTGTSRSRPSARRRSSPTSRSRSTRTTRATSSASEGGGRALGRAPRAGDRRRARRARVRHRARSRSRRATTRPTSTSAATTTCRSSRCIGPDGRVTAEGFEGLDQEEADERVVDWLQGARPAREARALPSLGRALRALPLADRAADLAAVVVLDGRAEEAGARGAARRAGCVYHPESQHRFAIESLENAPDWCVSRQLWWGHQIPIWTCPDGHVTAAEERPRRAPSAARPS